ncbi:Uncharacterized protein APZ42_029976, partial [Daphnia magna]
FTLSIQYTMRFRYRCDAWHLSRFLTTSTAHFRCSISAVFAQLSKLFQPPCKRCRLKTEFMPETGAEYLLDKLKNIMDYVHQQNDQVKKLQEEVVQLKFDIVSIKVAFADTAINNFNTHVANSNTSYPAKLYLSSNRSYAQAARGPAKPVLIASLSKRATPADQLSLSPVDTLLDPNSGGPIPMSVRQKDDQLYVKLNNAADFKRAKTILENKQGADQNTMFSSIPRSTVLYPAVALFVNLSFLPGLKDELTLQNEVLKHKIHSVKQIFVKPGYCTSFLDITLVTDNVLVSRWFFPNLPSHSDHPYIFFEIARIAKGSTNNSRETTSSAKVPHIYTTVSEPSSVLSHCAAHFFPREPPSSQAHLAMSSEVDRQIVAPSSEPSPSVLDWELQAAVDSMNTKSAPGPERTNTAGRNSALATQHPILVYCLEDIPAAQANRFEFGKGYDVSFFQDIREKYQGRKNNNRRRTQHPTLVQGVPRYPTRPALWLDFKK